MYSTCLFCNGDLGRNDLIETLPIGRRLAFDPAGGRLWVICRRCAKWNLVPFDTRLETIDTCERLFRHTRTRFSTDNIGLARLADGVELVRIGPALRPEFASWRYGAQYRRRRRQAIALGSVGVGAVAVGAGMLGAAGMSVGAFGVFIAQGLARGWGAGLDRKARFMTTDPLDGEPLRINRAMSQRAVLTWDEGEPTLEVPIPNSDATDARVARWQGDAVRTVGRRVTGGINLLLGKTADLNAAVELLASEQGDLTRWTQGRALLQRRDGDHVISKKEADNDAWIGRNVPAHWTNYRHAFLRLEKLQSAERLAVELWLNEDIERTWLTGELGLVEGDWGEAERLARIADNLAVSPESESQWQQLTRRSDDPAAG